MIQNGKYLTDCNIYIIAFHLDIVFLYVEMEKWVFESWHGRDYTDVVLGL